MSEADKLFFEAGFDDKKEKLSRITYYMNLPILKPSISFDKKTKTITVYPCITLESLKAINMKCKELGWEV